MSTAQNRPSDQLQSNHSAEEFRRIARRVEQLEREMEHLHRLSLAGRVAGVLAHEFNNVLTPILNYAEMALASPENRDLTRKALERAHAGSRHAARMAASILGLVRGSEEMFHVEHRGDEACGVSEAVEEAVACLVRPPSRDGVELSVEVGGELRAGIDGTSLSQVVLNLLLNGIEAMRPRGGHLGVSACAEGGERVVIEVSDTGRGIEEWRLERIFEAFESSGVWSDNASVLAGGVGGGRGCGGVGLGLAICRRLVEGAGGGISARSVVGEGTTFRIELPRAVGKAVRAAA